MTMQRVRLRVRGRVQGVGFRPFVWRIAQAHRLSGWVRNSSAGVEIDWQGEAADLAAAQAALRSALPPLAQISGLDESACPPEFGRRGFTVTTSAEDGENSAELPADAACCDACLDEMFDPHNRRFGYALTNCTDCGPRYTVTHALPYDRCSTSMAGFTMCAACQREYDDPDSRRFHAEPNACPDCGPQLHFCDANGQPVAGDCVALAVAALRRGEILAIKDLGGFHLVCDATQAEAVARLRTRKHRPSKPFAVMVPNVASATQWAQLSPLEADALTSSARPVVIAQRHSTAGLEGVGGGDRIGLILPSTPLHWLLFAAWHQPPPNSAWRTAASSAAWVLTSANRSGAPLVIDNDDALSALAGIADGFVLHNRPIVCRADDSVVQQLGASMQVLRRGRGEVPKRIDVGHARGGPSQGGVLALGSYLKNTVCWWVNDRVQVSAHLGDLDHPDCCEALWPSVERVLAWQPAPMVAVACEWTDGHFGQRLAADLAQRWQVPLIEVQHHHAHIAAVIAEHDGGATPVLGLAVDGFGLGWDGALWGGELLRVEGAHVAAFGHLLPLRLAGGERAIHEPWRLAAGLLADLGREEEILPRFGHHPAAAIVAQQLARDVNCPRSRGLGRWFEAVAALCAGVSHQSFEGEAAQILEQLAAHAVAPATPETFHAEIENGHLSLWPVVADLLANPALPADLAQRWHQALAAVLAEWVIDGAARAAVNTVVLAGGCCANRTLIAALKLRLHAAGLQVWMAKALPVGDGGLSVGQAWVARQQLGATSAASESKK